VEEITNSLIDRILVAQREYDRELYLGFSHSKRDSAKAELEEAKETLARYIKQLQNNS
jgi:hypothetical protein